VRLVQPPNRDAAPTLDALVDLLQGRRVVALTGAGVSTESGIPDYRSPESAARVRRPIHGPEFVRSAAVRRRYWSRAMVGWERFRDARPGPAHVALARLEAAGIVTDVITQNVDRLHHAAGSQRVIELHGALAEVACLACGAIEDRGNIQARMRATNELAEVARVVAPDGDAEISDEAAERFVVPACLACGGVLKPRVVFFGDNVPRAVVDDAFARVEAAGVLLVVGTSLAVFSGYRFLRRAAELGRPIAIVNRGPVRGEEHATLKLEAGAGETLEAIVGRLLRAPREPARD
jgi:NAD-dependent SIR2 family protein deacetylase